MHQDKAALRSLIEKKADVNAPLVDGSTALHWAVENDDAGAIELLLQAGAIPDAKDRYGLTPLYYASSNGNAAIIQKLLKAGANPNVADKDGDTALMAAARAGNPEAVTALLGHDAAVNAKDGLTQQTALMWAVRANQRGCGAGSAGARRRCQRAHQNGQDSGTPASRSRRRSRERLPRDRHRSRRLAGTGRPGRDTGGDVGAPVCGARRPAGQREIVSRGFDAAKADVNQTEANGITPLLMAITNDHVDVAQFLLDRGAAVNTADWWGRTPLWAAVEVRNRDMGREANTTSTAERLWTWSRR